MSSMRGLVGFAIAALAAGAVSAQSLSELAKKEKERREKNRAQGKQVIVLDESDLSPPPESAGEGEGETPGGGAEAAPVAPVRPRVSPPRPPEISPPGESESQSEGDEEMDEEPLPPEEIPLAGDRQQRLRDWELMKKSHLEEMAKIDEEIARNEERLAEIEQELSSLGAGGLPVAPRVDPTPRYDGAFHGLMAEKGQLIERNQELEERKVRSREELLEKARRGGIPPGYLRF